jgi:hypothetical protein
MEDGIHSQSKGAGKLPNGLQDGNEIGMNKNPIEGIIAE